MWVGLLARIQLTITWWIIIVSISSSNYYFAIHGLRDILLCFTQRASTALVAADGRRWNATESQPPMFINCNYVCIGCSATVLHSITAIWLLVEHALYVYLSSSWKGYSRRWVTHIISVGWLDAQERRLCNSMRHTNYYTATHIVSFARWQQIWVCVLCARGGCSQFACDILQQQRRQANKSLWHSIEHEWDASAAVAV